MQRAAHPTEDESPQPPRRALRAVAPVTAEPATTSLKQPAFYSNRELSWLEFNDRVLAQATDPSHPLLERVKFLAISANNLDEFFMIRVATTQKKVREGINDVGADGYGTQAQLKAMWERSAQMITDQAACWADLRLALEAEEIRLLEPEDWPEPLQVYLEDYFRREIFPVVTPLAFDPGHPFPLISNLSKNLAVVVRHGGRMKFARVKVPSVLPRFIPIPAELAPSPGVSFAYLEDVMRANVHLLFPGTQIKGAYLFRIVRDADLEIEQDEADDLLETVDRSLRQLPRGAISLLHVEAGMPDRVLKILAENFEVTSDVVVRSSDRLGLADWMDLARLDRPDLHDTPSEPKALWREGADPDVIFEQIRQQDQLIHHPYESFESVMAFLSAAADDPRVLAIKMTLYRIGANSPLVGLLSHAAQQGKQVTVLVELKARFDERNNIEWAKKLESDNIHVVYGFADLKTHAKLCLVVRKEDDGIRRYVHTGTGNYNPQTARIYTDFGLFTCDPDIVADVSDVFNYLTGYSNQKQFRQIHVAPIELRGALSELIKRETEHARNGRPAHLVFKMNSLTDDQMVRALYRASQAGVDIDLIVRGTCCLRPGIAGVSDRIQVRSIIGRFLEHSRVYWFANGGADEMYIGSADLMERNLDRRVETLTPIRDAARRQHLREIVLGTCLRDNARAWLLDEHGHYARATGRDVDGQRILLQHYSDVAAD
ncbi:MAG: polyphosphate kinase 1 [Vicinamibacterales bacterium]